MATLRSHNANYLATHTPLETQIAQVSSEAPQIIAAPRLQTKTRHNKGVIARACTWTVDHQISISFNSIALLFLIHASYPSARRHTAKFFQLSHFNPYTGNYAAGWDDKYFVFFWVMVFTGLRCAFMDYLLTPMASWLGLRKPKARVRFAEQAWIFIYYTVFWSMGMYIMYHSDFWLNLRALWQGWPRRELDALTKFHYLIELAFYMQQIIVVNIEEKRKDHWQMVVHHVITCALIFGSYGYNITKVGTLIMCLMDVVDLFLPLAKIFRYLRYQLVCDVTFGVFMVIWLAARHLWFFAILYSLYFHLPEEIPWACWRGPAHALEGPFPSPDGKLHFTEPYINPNGMICGGEKVRVGFFVLLLLLQIVLFGWFFLIIRIAYRVISGQGADDVRSDDDDDGECEEEELEEAKKLQTNKVATSDVPANSATRMYIEREVESSDAHFSYNAISSGSRNRLSTASAPVRRSSRRKGDSASVNLLAGDHKDLLGRIGCDKPTGGD